MSRAKSSSNYLIVSSLLNSPIDLSVLKALIPSFSKRLSELKKMGFEFEEVVDTNTGILCLDIIYMPVDTIINHDTQTINVGNYWKNYRNDIEMKRIEEEYPSEFAIYNPPIYWIAIKNFITKLFK